MSDSAPPQPDPPTTPTGPSPRRLRRALAGAMLIGLLIMLARSAAIVEVTSETWDEDYHILHGLLDLTNARHATPVPIGYNDPPLGGMLVALPAWLAGATVTGVPEPDRPEVYHWPERPSSLWGQQYSPNTLRHLISAWKCVLMLPGLAAAFLWARGLYGPMAGWLAWGLYLFDPTIAAMTPVASLDSLGLSLGLAAAYLIWRYIEAPTLRNVVLASLLTAAALLTKHTAAMLPVYAVIGGLVVWVLRRDSVGEAGGVAAWLRALAIHAARIGAAAVLTLLFIWPLTKFDVSPPLKTQTISRDLVAQQTPWWEVDAPEWRKRRLPAGAYIGSLAEGQRHNAKGHPGFLLGEKREMGWWYYFPVVMTYKAPLGHLVVMGLGLLSFAWRRPRLAEAPLWIAIACFWALLLTANINIGFRHALLPYALLLIAATRCAGRSSRETSEDACDTGAESSSPRRVGARVWTLPAILAFAALAISALHVTWWHPNYIPYVNWPREKVYLDISDSNLDWGQSARQVGKWLEEHRNELPQPIYYSGFGPPQPVRRYVKDVHPVGRELPSEGTLIISPVNVAGVYRGNDHFAPLWEAEPVDVIAETMLVFDLSEVPR